MLCRHCGADGDCVGTNVNAHRYANARHRQTRQLYTTDTRHTRCPTVQRADSTHLRPTLRVRIVGGPNNGQLYNGSSMGPAEQTMIVGTSGKDESQPEVATTWSAVAETTMSWRVGQETTASSARAANDILAGGVARTRSPAGSEPTNSTWRGNRHRHRLQRGKEIQERRREFLE